MPYPMMRWPTFLEFRQKLEKDFGVEYKKLPHSIALAPSGDSQSVFYLERKLEDGRTRRYAVVIPDDERIDPLVIRSICRQLNVDPAAFGLHLG